MPRWRPLDKRGSAAFRFGRAAGQEDRNGGWQTGLQGCGQPAHGEIRSITAAARQHVACERSIRTLTSKGYQSLSLTLAPWVF